MKTIPFLIAITIWGLSGCQFILDEQGVEGSGIVDTKEYAFSAFENLEISGSFEVKLIPSNEHKVVVTVDDNLIDYVQVKQNGSTVSVKTKSGTRFSSRQKIKVDIYLEKLKNIELAGSSRLQTTARMVNDDRMNFTIAGSGQIVADIKTPRIEVSIGGSGKVQLKGETKIMELRIGGSGDCLAENLLAEKVEIRIGGSGNAEVFASKTLDITIAGSGNVYYSGSPEVNKTIAGSGVVKARGQ